ncbi:DUF885 domain-containing protein [Streptomyces hebeiensis]
MTDGANTLARRPTAPRRIADDHTDALIALDPVLGTMLGHRESHSGLPDFSPDGLDAVADLARHTLRRLDGAHRVHGAHGGGPVPPGEADLADAAERNCARLLRERLTAELAMHETGETLRSLSPIYSPVYRVRTALTLTPTGNEEEWRLAARRLRSVPASLDSYRASLAEGLRRNLPGGPAHVAPMIVQLGEWAGERSGNGGWFGRFAAGAPEPLRGEVEGAARAAADGVLHLRNWLREVYAPAVDGAPDVAGPDRYAVTARYYTGTDLDPAEAYAYGWSEFHRLREEMRVEAAKILPDAASPRHVLTHLDTHGHAVEGEERVRAWLQDLMDQAIDRLDGTHFEIADRIRRVESRIAPPGGAAAPYYTAPSQDFTRPGRTWLPTLGRRRFPTYELVSTWYHEGVPGHHLQLAQWAHRADRLTRYQTAVGTVSAGSEGWALYAERLMDELGFLADPEHRLGHLDLQLTRAVRVVIDLGTHLSLTAPAHSPHHPGERWTPASATAFLRAHCARPDAFVRSEMTRYLSTPGQAIGYKLGERAWLRGREAARRRRGSAFDLKRWHMAALSQGSLGLADLEAELAVL